MLKAWLSTSLLLFLLACGGEDDDRQELIDKMRGIGMSFSPVVSPPSIGSDIKTVIVTVYVALPIAKKISVEKYLDQIRNTSRVQLSPEQYDILKIEDPITYPGLSIVKFQAKLKVPDLKALPPGGALVHFGFLLKADSNQEKMIGSYLVLPQNAELWKAPLLKINNPTESADLQTNDTIPVAFNKTNANDEDVKVAWFVSGGKITNRRSENTFWESPKDKGDYTLIATIRGRKSRAFAIDIRTVHLH